MNLYLDASVLVALFTDDVLAERADAFLRTNPAVLLVSDFAEAEFASAVARHVRMKKASKDDAWKTFTLMDAWISREAIRVRTTSADISAAAGFIRSLDASLRTPDAIHIAIAQRTGTDIFTFDMQMRRAARRHGVAAVE